MIIVPKIYFQIPDWIQRLYKGVYWRVQPERKAVYLTFDDGPIPQVTPQVLDILQQYNIKATFFMVAENAVKYPDIFESVKMAGHTIGNHTYNHLKGRKLSTEEYLNNIARANDVLKTPHFRPPYGSFTRKQLHAVQEKGYKVYLWDVLTHDYNQRFYTPKMIIKIVKSYTRNGSLINFHDSVKSISNVLGALPQVIEHLLKQGYEILPL